VSTRPDSHLGRIVIRHLHPRQPDGPWPAKAYAGEVVEFIATVFREGHDIIGANLELTSPTGATKTIPFPHPPHGVDEWRQFARVDEEGEWSWRVCGYADDWATWLHAADIKIAAGVDVELMFTIGLRILDGARAGRNTASNLARLNEVADRFADVGGDPATRIAAAHDAAFSEALAANAPRSLETWSEPVPLRVERTRAGYGAWYEFFPRSEGAVKNKDGSVTSGTFVTARKRLAQIANDGFDVLYLPPIHPIGRANRKGPNNTLDAKLTDPGSPWAIGAAEGGHEAIHPDLGNLADFEGFVAEAAKHGIEIALDLALQCSPDHPWVQSHPEWFTTLPDGTIAYAENPPKKYQDIYPLNFDNDYEGLRAEILRIVELWIARGVSIFRVDNPHTKPVHFWEWLIGEVNRNHPEVVFLAEAFTRPAMMHTLAAVGFQQSYTYFTWRNHKHELADYFTEVSQHTSAFFRPNFFVNTPDILTEYLQFGGIPAYKIRAALAATAAPTWGMYAGFELIENVARPGSEENIDNEKYEYKFRDFAGALKAGRSIAPYVARLNSIRRAHPALQQLRNLRIQHTDDDAILAFSKYLPAHLSGTGKPDGIIVIASTDPHAVRETMVRLDLSLLGLPRDASFTATDLITGNSYTWGSDNFVRLDSFTEPVHIISVGYGKVGTS
jgi:starch synthase (maltosyl-transferring)